MVSRFLRSFIHDLYLLFDSDLIRQEFLPWHGCFSSRFPPINIKWSLRNYFQSLRLDSVKPAATITHNLRAFITCLELYQLTDVVMMALGQTFEARERLFSLSVSFKSRGAFWSLMLLTKVSQIEMLKTVDHHLCYHGDRIFFSFSEWRAPVSWHSNCPVRQWCGRF